MKAIQTYEFDVVVSDVISDEKVDAFTDAVYDLARTFGFEVEGSSSYFDVVKNAAAC